ncbi:hypothetical protein TRFO_24103 [Tritrichomonas foetus]|uniref:Right handed beta helix domain-containing protein n=1 Tax=Tritrichomonas foetus TaxID=1144522 RepID=A0A1J4K9U5_9EUKA|nr:hypothetical protein TRFO_24103 [Tritrichomonas foetus]|eukprot:OHT07680.1 hypothetical protein TRFO_24103 [Tritrichomonas foetus]
MILKSTFKISSEGLYIRGQKYTDSLRMTTAVTFDGCYFQKCYISINPDTAFSHCFFQECGNGRYVCRNRNTVITDCLFEKSDGYIDTTNLNASHIRIFSSTFSTSCLQGNHVVFKDGNFTNNQGGKNILSYGTNTQIPLKFEHIIMAYNSAKDSIISISCNTEIDYSFIVNNNGTFIKSDSRSGDVNFIIRNACIFVDKGSSLYNEQDVHIKGVHLINCSINMKSLPEKVEVIDVSYDTTKCKHVDCDQFTPIPERKYFDYKVIGEVNEKFAY